MILNSFNIAGLFGHWILKSDLDSRINILTGDNGSFKTNLIKILRDFLSVKQGEGNIEKGSLDLSDGDDRISLYYRHFEDSLLSLKKVKDDELLSELAAQVQADLKDTNEKTLSERILKADITGYKKNGKTIHPADFKKSVNVDFISTFDIPQKNTNDRESYLDEMLADLEKKYAYYMSDLAQKVKGSISNKGKIDLGLLSDIYQPNAIFTKIINDSFKNTGKTLDTSRSELHFLVDGERLTTSQLSSGEKQWLIIMLTVLMERQEKYILLMDEPEISLHLEWQSKLIDNIFKINPNCQIIMTSHSPGIILHGWEQYTIQMSNITERMVGKNE